MVFMRHHTLQLAEFRKKVGSLFFLRYRDTYFVIPERGKILYVIVKIVNSEYNKLVINYDILLIWQSLAKGPGPTTY